MNVQGDFLVIGSGIAGLRAALSLAEAGDVVVLTKADPRESNTGYAQGGIAVAVGPDDSPALHAQDTVAAGDGLCDPAAVEVLVREGPRYVQELIDWGAAFDRDTEGRLSLGREAAHTARRVLHAKDTTGSEIARVLWSRVSAHPRIHVLDDATATELLVSEARCVGATFLTSSGEPRDALASHTLLATGGAGQVFRETTNPAVATGDGIAMAFLAGARVTDLEFVQFHPTVLSVEGSPRFLLSEALRGEGARLVNDAGGAFTTRYDDAGDLAPRDVVARAIADEAARTGAPIYLTLSHLDSGYVHRRFPRIARACAAVGLDLARDRIPVSPAAHYVMGGIQTDLEGRTSVPGLLAAGEAACTGVHGANRLASNSLLEGLVFGARAASVMRSSSPQAASFVDPPTACPPMARSSEPGSDGDSPPSPYEVRDLMWRDVGLLRDRGRLQRAVAALERWYPAARARTPAACDAESFRLASLVTVGLLIARAALRREESRGAHFRTDFSSRDDLHWKRHVADVLARA